MPVGPIEATPGHDLHSSGKVCAPCHSIARNQQIAASSQEETILHPQPKCCSESEKLLILAIIRAIRGGGRIFLQFAAIPPPHIPPSLLTSKYPLDWRCWCYLSARSIASPPSSPLHLRSCRPSALRPPQPSASAPRSPSPASCWLMFGSPPPFLFQSRNCRF